jgi:hypothetical protein
LASDDLLAFAMHTRRLIENTILPKRAMFLVPVVAGGEGDACPITRIINVIIHNKEITIERRAQRSGGPLRPIALVRSDRGQLIAFWIEELLKVFVADLLDPIYDVCVDNGMMLDIELNNPSL